MNTSEIFLLSLINQTPRYGYEITQFLEDTNASLWVNISMPYVYRLLKTFEERGWVSARVVESPNNRPNKNIFEITPKGQNMLQESLHSEQFNTDRIYFGMDVALAVYATNEQSFDLPTLLEAQVQRTKDELSRFHMDNPNHEKLSDQAVIAMLIIEHRICFLQAELLWLEKVQATLKKLSSRER